jgi:mycoredoxin
MFAKWFNKKNEVPQALLIPSEVTVYGTTWCGDTRRSRNLLTTFKVPYIWVDIDKDKQGEAYVREINRGNRSVPTIIFKDGTILVEPNDSELTAALIAITSPATE